MGTCISDMARIIPTIQSLFVGGCYNWQKQQNCTIILKNSLKTTWYDIRLMITNGKIFYDANTITDHNKFACNLHNRCILWDNQYNGSNSMFLLKQFMSLTPTCTCSRPLRPLASACALCALSHLLSPLAPASNHAPMSHLVKLSPPNIWSN